MVALKSFFVPDDSLKVLRYQPPAMELFERGSRQVWFDKLNCGSDRVQ
jgi:hypothetical protein